jgi:hypothetical protein
MTIERYCINPECAGGDQCLNKFRNRGQQCTMEYVASKTRPEYNWLGEGLPPPRWTAPDGTIVYRTFADYVED